MRLYWRRGRGVRPSPWAEPGELRDYPTSAPPASPADAAPRAVLWGARAGEALVFVDAAGGVEVLASVDVDTTVLLQGLPPSGAGQLRVDAR